MATAIVAYVDISGMQLRMQSSAWYTARFKSLLQINRWKLVPKSTQKSDNIQLCL